MTEIDASNDTKLPTRIAVEDYSWFLQNDLAKGLVELEQDIGPKVKENMTILCGYNVSKLIDSKELERVISFHGYAILDMPLRVYRKADPRNFPRKYRQKISVGRGPVYKLLCTYLVAVRQSGVITISKLMLSIRNESFQRISSEAMERGVMVRELLMAVIVPEWVRENMRPPLHLL